jgi:CHASE3 domain sensor protein
MTQTAEQPLFPPAASGRVPLHVIAIIVVSIALLVINASLLIINTAATMDSNAHYARSSEIKRSLITFQSVITALESSQRGYLLTGQTGYLEPYHVAMRSWRKQIDRLRELTVDDPTRLADITALEGLTTAAASRLEQTIRSSPQPGPHGNADVAGTDRATETMDRVRGVVDRLMSEEDARIEASRREVVRDMWVGAGVAVLATVVTVAVLIALNKLLQRYVRDRESALRALREANQHLNQLVEDRTAELTELSQHLIRVSEEEKAKLARELHDTLGSNLTAINMDLNWIQRRLPEDKREVRERLQRVLQMLADTVELKHEVIEGLRPGVRDALALSRVHPPHRPGVRSRRARGLRRPRSRLVDRVLSHRPGGADQHHEARAGDPGTDHAGARARRPAPAGQGRWRRPDGRSAGEAEVARSGRHARAHARDGGDVCDPASVHRPGHRCRGLRPQSTLVGLQRCVGRGLRRQCPASAQAPGVKMIRWMSGTFRHRHAVVSPEGPRTANRGDRYGKPDDRNCSGTRRARVFGA